MTDTLIVTEDSTPTLPVVESSPDPLGWIVQHDGRHSEHEFRHTEILQAYQEHENRCDDKLNAMSERIASLESRPEPESPSSAARTDALEEITEVGEVIADIADAVTGGDDVPPPSAPRRAPNPGGAGLETETLVTPDGDESTGVTTGVATAPSRNNRRRGWRGAW